MLKNGIRQDFSILPTFDFYVKIIEGSTLHVSEHAH